MAVSLLMYNAVGHSFEFKFVLPWNSIIISIIGVFLITFAIYDSCRRKMKHDNITDTLKQENLTCRQLDFGFYRTSGKQSWSYGIILMTDIQFYRKGSIM